MKVPFVDLLLQHKELGKGINQAVAKVLKRGDFILGAEVGQLEREFAVFCGSRYALGVSSGTAALFLALKALGIKEGDEVIVPAFTFIATAFAVSQCGAKPVFVDIREDTYNIDPQQIRKAVNKHTRAIIPVHLFGQPAQMAGILSIARERNLAVIEDAAQAHGAEIKMPDGKWRAVGSLGVMGCFSFYPSKNLGGVGDGGMITTDSHELYVRLLMLRDQGRISKYNHAIIGYNSRLDTLQAAVLRLKLKKLRAWNRMRRQNALIYRRCLQNSAVVIPNDPGEARHVYHVYAVRAGRRAEVYRKLLAKGVSALIHYPIPLHLQKAYRHLGYAQGDFPVAEKVSREIISLPMYPHLKQRQIKYVSDSVREALKSQRRGRK